MHIKPYLNLVTLRGKMMTKDEALKMAIEYIEKSQYEKHDEVINACKEALEQPQPRLFLDLSNSHGNHPVEQLEQECKFCKSREVNFDDDDFDEARTDVVGQNGNEGLHYD